MKAEESNSRVAEKPKRKPFRFESLTVWQSARQLSSGIYHATREFPRDEVFGLTSQMRRAAVSVVANIAEGSGRNSDPDFARFLEIAYGSAMELAALLHVAVDAGHLSILEKERLGDAIFEVTAQISALNRSLKVERSKTPFPRAAAV